MKKLLAKIRKILRDRRTRRFLTRFVSGAAALIVFVTTYALVLPAITMEKEANCGIEAHQHDDSCYTEELICDIPESDGHHHDESCYSTASALVCETEEHEHSVENGCYDDEGNLICEVMEHRHNEECYEEVRELTCKIPESEGHHHTEDCYEKALTCGKEAHVHSTACYEDDPVSDAAVAAGTSSAAAATTSAGSVSSAGMTLNFEGDIDKVVDFDETVETDKTDDIGFVDNSGSDETNRSSETTGTSEIASSSETNKEAASGSEVTYGRENAGTGRTETSNAALTNADNSATALTSSADTDQYIPQLDAVDFNTVLNNHTGIYYYRAADEDIVEDSSAIPAEDWNRIPNNIDRINDDMDDVELGNKDLLRVYLSYTISAGSLNATNSVARYRLPSNLHLTDPQVKAINENVNGLAGQYVDMSTLEITDPDKYNAYLGVEAVEGTRRPDEAVEDYLAKQARKAGKDADDATEYISAVVRVENVYDADGLYGEKDAYLGQDLIFTFAPYSIEKNQHEYDSTGKPTRAGEEIKGWFTFDLNMGQVDFEEPEITTSTAEETSNIEDNVDGDSERSHSEDENTEEKHIENVQTEDDHNGDDLIKEDSIEDGHKDESNEENHSVNNATVDVNTADDESSEDGKADDNQDHAVTIERAERTAEIIFVEEEWNGKDKKTDQISTTLTAVEETVLEAQNDDKLEDDEDPSVSGEKERLEEENEGALSDEATADGNVKDPVDTEQVIMPAMSFNDSIKVSTGKPVGIDENAGSFLANAAESLPEEAEVSVRVEADEGTFPAGTTMVLSAVDQSSYDTLAETLAETVERRETSDTDISDTDTSEAKANTQQAETDNAEDQEIKQNTEQNNADNNTNIKTYGFQAVDITFFDKDGNEIEPAKPVRVALTSKVVEQAREKAEESAIADPVVVHVDNEGKAEQMDLVSPEEVEPAKGRSEEELLEEAEKTAESGKTDNADDDISADDVSGKKDVEHKADSVDESASAVSMDTDEAEESSTEGITAQEDRTVEEDGENRGKSEFTADSFSVYAIVYTVELYTNVITDSGETYRISVTYDETSGIPQDAELKVKEIKEGDKGYEDYYTEAVKAASESSDAQNDASNHASDKDNKRVNPDKTYARFFDIEIWADGGKIEPAGDVSVSIRLLDVPETDDRNIIKIVHFDKDDIEIIPYTAGKDDAESADTTESHDDEQISKDSIKEAMEVTFTASSFSVYSVVSYTVDFYYELNGKMYDFSIPGGGFVSLAHVVEALGIGKDTAYTENGSENTENAGENTAHGEMDDGDPSNSAIHSAVDFNTLKISEETSEFVVNVDKVEFSNPELVWVGKVNKESTVGELKNVNSLHCEYSSELKEEQIEEINAQKVDAGDWALISLLPFTTYESLTVTMKTGEVFTIQVTDARDDTYPYEKGTTFTGFNTREDGFIINLFDYGPESDLDNGNNQIQSNGSQLNSGINYNHSLKFQSYGRKPSEVQTFWGNSWQNVLTYNHFSGTEAATQGIVQNVLSGGYPKLSGSGGESLAYLFNTTPDNSNKEVYKNVTGLFQKDINGKYYYDSNVNYAYYNKDQGNSGSFELSDTFPEEGSDWGVGFFPFNPWNGNKTCIHWKGYCPQTGGDNGSRYYYDHHFGMTLDGVFQLSPTGQVNGEDMVFNFSGDDDLWVFIDDVLVLDIGGIHNPVGGSINFKTGQVTVNSVYQVNSVINDSVSGPAASTTIQQCFTNAGKTWNPEAYSDHTIKVFYVERGGCYSNCQMEFNITMFKDIEFDKKDNLGSGVPGAEFRLYKQDNTPLMETYYDHDDNTYKEREYVRISDENGHVKFDHVPVGTYYLKEISAPEGYLSDDTTYIVKIEVIRQEGQEGYVIRSYILNGDNQNVTEIINTKIDYIDIGVEKKWTGDPPDGATATFALRRTYSYEADEDADDDEFNDNSPTITVSNVNQWTGSFDHQPIIGKRNGHIETYKYYIEETGSTNATGYHPLYMDSNGNLLPDPASPGTNTTGTQTVYNVRYVDVPVYKSWEWSDSDGPKVDSWSVTFYLQYREEYLSGTPDAPENVQSLWTYVYDGAAPKQITITNDAGETDTGSDSFENLPMYRVHANGSIYRLKYAVDEVEYKLYTSGASTPYKTWSKDSSSSFDEHYSPIYEVDAGQGSEMEDLEEWYSISLTNAPSVEREQNTIGLGINKAWEGENGEILDNPPDGSFTASFKLKRYYHEEYLDLSNYDENNLVTVTLDLGDGYKSILEVPSGAPVYFTADMYKDGNVDLSFRRSLPDDSAAPVYLSSSNTAQTTGTDDAVVFIVSDPIIQPTTDETWTLVQPEGEGSANAFDDILGGVNGIRLATFDNSPNPEFPEFSYDITGEIFDEYYHEDFELTSDNGWAKSWEKLPQVVEVKTSRDNGNNYLKTIVYSYFFEEIQCNPPEYYAVFRDHNNSEVRYGDELSRVEVSNMSIDAINKPAPEIQIYKVDEKNINQENVEQYLLSKAGFKVVKYKSFTPLAKDKSWGTDGVKTATRKENDPDGKFTVDGLAPGLYEIVETAYPDGYIQTTVNPRFKVVINSQENLEIVSLTEDAAVNIVNNYNNTGNNVIICGNTPGAVLPNSGGSGTRFFTILGSILIAGAGLLMLSRRRII